MDVAPSLDRAILLLAVVEHGSMSRVAEQLGYSVSAVSQQLRKAGLEAGLPLLRRHGRGVSLTIAGEPVVESAQCVRGRWEALAKELDDLRELRTGRLSIGTSPTAG